jgi:hypothetical protein
MSGKSALEIVALGKSPGSEVYIGGAHLVDGDGVEEAQRLGYIVFSGTKPARSLRGELVPVHLYEITELGWHALEMATRP